jgi:hypothetical protein
MSLPKIKFPIYTITLPLAKKKIQFRPFVAKEEKLLLMAQQGSDVGYIVDVTKQVLNNVIVTDINVDEMTTPDVEYFFLKLRAKSIGETVEMMIKDEEDGKRYTVVFDLEKLDVTKNTNKTNTIDLGDGIGITMKPPTIDTMKKYANVLAQEGGLDNIEYQIIRDTIESVFDAETVYDLNAETDEEITEFLDQLTPANLAAIRAYYEGLPKVTLSAKYTTEAGKEKTIVLEGLASFFQLG